MTEGEVLSDTQFFFISNRIVSQRLNMWSLINNSKEVNELKKNFGIVQIGLNRMLTSSHSDNSWISVFCC